jgi:hypothetical protein
MPEELDVLRAALAEFYKQKGFRSLSAKGKLADLQSR